MKPGIKLVLYAAIIAAALVVGYLHARTMSFVDDDCFMSFRYAKNLVNGLGLVYNAGERVEGYTNFLWTVIIAFGMKLGFDPVDFSLALGMVFYLLTLSLYGIFSLKMPGSSGGLIIPLTTLALVLHRDASAYATSGMETSMFSFLLSASFVVLCFTERPRGYLGAGLLLTIAMLTRPDGVIFLAASAVGILITERRPWKPTVFLLAPAVAIFLPYWIWRYEYYGFFFPNTFYAKSIGLSYYTQGLTFAWLYFKTYYVFLLLPLLGAAMLWRSVRMNGAASVLRSTRVSGGQESGIGRPLMIACLFVVFYCLFIVRIGGDFMFARFFIPITPLMFAAIEMLIRSLRRRAVHVGLSLLVLAATFLRFDQYGDRLFVDEIADEARYYTAADLQRAKEEGSMLRHYFAGLPVRTAFDAGLLRLIYYVDPPYGLEASAGLTDTALAHQVLAVRGRPGHEKHATIEDLISRRINFYFGYYDSLPGGERVLNAIRFKNLIERIITYDTPIMSRLAQYPEVRFVRIPAYLDNYISTMRTLPRDQVQSDYSFLKSFYFDRNNDLERERAFRSYLGTPDLPGAGDEHP